MSYRFRVIARSFVRSHLSNGKLVSWSPGLEANPDPGQIFWLPFPGRSTDLCSKRDDAGQVLFLSLLQDPWFGSVQCRVPMMGNCSGGTCSIVPILCFTSIIHFGQWLILAQFSTKTILAHSSVLAVSNLRLGGSAVLNDGGHRRE